MEKETEGRRKKKTCVLLSKKEEKTRFEVTQKDLGIWNKRWDYDIKQKSKRIF